MLKPQAKSATPQAVASAAYLGAGADLPLARAGVIA
jgi:hypothetical protein